LDGIQKTSVGDGPGIEQRERNQDRIFSLTRFEEIVMRMDSKSGATLAAAAATLFLASAAVSTVTTTAYAATGKCIAANACKGQSACKSATNSCKGQNACKGQGFAAMSSKQCDVAGGKFVKS
jgi:uncharacterized protein YgiB involved in biofilm formation